MLRRTAVNILAQNKSQNGPGSSDPVKMLSRLLGPDVVLLPVWAKSKKPKDSNWTKLTSKDMQSPRHLHQLHYSNIGVLLGKASGGLCTIDIDSDELVGEFLKANPLLKQTLQSKGQRGQNFWVKAKGDYPSTKKIISKWLPVIEPTSTPQDEQKGQENGLENSGSRYNCYRFKWRRGLYSTNGK